LPPITPDQLDHLLSCTRPHHEALDDLQSISRYKQTGFIDRDAIRAEEDAISQCFREFSASRRSDVH
jgi:hypothetical protein